MPDTQTSSERWSGTKGWWLIGCAKTRWGEPLLQHGYCQKIPSVGCSLFLRGNSLFPLLYLTILCRNCNSLSLLRIKVVCPLFSCHTGRSLKARITAYSSLTPLTPTPYFAPPRRASKIVLNEYPGWGDCFPLVCDEDHCRYSNVAFRTVERPNSR